MDQLLAGYARHGLQARPAAFELNWRLATTAAARDSFFVHLLRSFGLPKATAQLAVLRDIYLSDDKRLSQAQIMRIRGVTSGNVTRLIHALEKGSLVRRDTNPDDKRSTFVYLTDDGLAFCERLLPTILGDTNRLAECLSDAELAILNELLAKLHIHIEQMASELQDERYSGRLEEASAEKSLIY